MIKCNRKFCLRLFPNIVIQATQILKDTFLGTVLKDGCAQGEYWQKGYKGEFWLSEFMPI